MQRSGSSTIIAVCHRSCASRVSSASRCCLCAGCAGVGGSRIAPRRRPSSQLIALLAAVVSIVWMVNLYNFMDGSDGLAGLEAVLVAASGAAVAGSSSGPGVGAIAVVVAASSAGFLVWNWAPARIFLGDVGSYFLGFQFAAFAVVAALHGRAVWIWLILLAPFVTDADAHAGTPAPHRRAVVAGRIVRTFISASSSTDGVIAASRSRCSP